MPLFIPSPDYSSSISSQSGYSAQNYILYSGNISMSGVRSLFGSVIISGNGQSDGRSNLKLINGTVTGIITTESSATSGNYLRLGTDSSHNVSICVGGIQAAIFSTTGLDGCTIGQTNRQQGFFSFLNTTAYIPANYNSIGSSGHVSYGGGFIYIATGQNAWGRVAIAPW